MENYKPTVKEVIKRIEKYYGINEDFILCCAGLSPILSDNYNSHAHYEDTLVTTLYRNMPEGKLQKINFSDLN